MKIVYKGKELGNDVLSYNRLKNKPYIETAEMFNNVTSLDLGTYSIYDVEKALGDARTVVNTDILPIDPDPGTLYIIGPDDDGVCWFYLCDNTRKIALIGTSDSFYHCKEGSGFSMVGDVINLKINPNRFTFNTDNKVTINAVTVIDEFSDDEHIPTSKAVYEHDKTEIFDEVYPVGSVYIALSEDLIPQKGVWRRLPSDKTLINMEPAKAGTLIDPILPAIGGGLSSAFGIDTFAFESESSSGREVLFNRQASGSFYFYGVVDAGNPQYRMYNSSLVSIYYPKVTQADRVMFKASRSSSIYKEDNTDLVRPTSIAVCMWERIG